MWIYHTIMNPKDAEEMANSVDHDQTAPSVAKDRGAGLRSTLIWACTVYTNRLCPKMMTYGNFQTALNWLQFAKKMDYALAFLYPPFIEKEQVYCIWLRQ